MNISDIQIPENWKNVARIADRLDAILTEERSKEDELDILGRMDVLAGLLVTLVSYLGHGLTEGPEEFSVMEKAATSILQKVAYVKRNPELSNELAANVLKAFQEELIARRDARRKAARN